MIKHLTLSNLDIYTLAQQIVQIQQNEQYTNKSYPVKINFYLQKNQNVILDLAKEIEKERMDILQKFQDPTAEIEEDNGQQQIIIPKEKVDQVNQELNDLLALEQEVTIYTIDLAVFDEIEMTPQEFQAINFMITENFEEEEE